MKALEFIFGLLFMGVCLGFIAWVSWLIIQHKGPDESHSCIRYQQNRMSAKLAKKLRA